MDNQSNLLKQRSYVTLICYTHTQLKVSKFVRNNKEKFLLALFLITMISHKEVLSFTFYHQNPKKRLANQLNLSPFIIKTNRTNIFAQFFEKTGKDTYFNLRLTFCY